MVSLDFRHLHEISDRHMDLEFSIWTSEWQAKLNVQTLWEIVAPHSIEALRSWNWHVNTLIYHVYDIVYPCVSISIEFECVFLTSFAQQVPSRGVVLALICLSSSFPRWPSLPRPQNPQTEVLSRTTRCSSFGTETKDGKMRRPQGGLDGLWLSLINVSPTMQDERCHNHVGSHGRRADFPLALYFTSKKLVTWCSSTYFTTKEWLTMRIYGFNLLHHQDGSPCLPSGELT